MSERSLVCGIEIHQQLDTHKLFCECPGELSVSYTGEMVRRLRPTQSELGEIDRAALMEAQKKLLFRYMIPTTVCLVQQDEEPPHPVNPVALGTALLFSIMVHATPVDEVHYMRKIVVDGSNTAGFQRTALISQGGHVEVEGKKIGIQSICLEEDAARPIERKGGESVYNLDRLGIPLIEVATDPDIDSPEMARLVAEHIGMLLRATGKVRRGIGTIREDLNISIPGGARIETKGVQELRLISTYVKEEMARQERLLAAKEELLKRGGAIGEPVDVTTLLKDTGSKVLRRALDKGGVAMALELQGFAGLLGSYHDGKKCLGTELAGYAKTAGVGGLFHTDELPAYGVTQEEVDAIRDVMGLGAQDAFVLVADEPKRVGLAMERVIERAKMALKGVPEETRDPLQDGTTRYNRPLPGKARMYPETD
ncbi:MAG: Glu-tRNA(Gln) amidotransferase subunit GatE, partial [Thermoplasmata archaeon]|nr:Glu-tRNA(Gln) amidotransferase subunit GatE [Thermoplasmata archaeon]